MAGGHEPGCAPSYGPAMLKSTPARATSAARIVGTTICGAACANCTGTPTPANGNIISAAQDAARRNYNHARVT